ncbi:hypothetical protein [Yeosuana marina]|uniref:hypothetical protein n=1 Tax=Yeosuana marina TaxID=1565536 RepID=UPI0030C82854
MKTSNFRVISLLMLFSTLFSLPINAQVGIGTTAPNASSMLDIDVSTLDANAKKGILIPRMNTTDRTAISSPANGLLVYDTTTESLWFYNGTATTPAWQQLSASSISDADGNTKVEVEKNENEDVIRLSTAGTERMTIDNAGNTKIGDGTNNTYIEADGSLSYQGAATRWDDLRVSVNTVKIGSSWWAGTIESAAWGTFLGGTELIWFYDGTDADAVYFTVQMPHGWKEESNIYPHVHWTNKSAPGTARVTWALEYTWSNVGAGFSFMTPTTITGTTVATDPTGRSIAVNEHVITPLKIDSVGGTLTSGIDASGKTISSMLICKLYRKGSTGTADNYTGAAGLIEIDFHYQIDSDGSREQYTK